MRPSNHQTQHRCLAILGTRGIPAQHGGFETFAEQFALYLVEQGWQVRVYCQQKGRGEPTTRTWHGVELIDIPIENEGPWGTIVFDWISMRHACKASFQLLTLGYNTALFSVLPRLKKRRNVMNMDGIEWQRQKWSFPIKIWFYLNEIAGCLLANQLVADHPEIKKHLQRWAPAEKITTLPYGAPRVTNADPAPLKDLGVTENNYLLIIARPEPENSILEMVEAFCQRPRGVKLLILGNYQPAKNSYHRKVKEAANDDVIFPGAIYDPRAVESLRLFCRFYLHGHQVGGTNPSLVEAMGCGCAVIAHDNRFNRWVVADGARYFANKHDLSGLLTDLLDDTQQVTALRSASIARHEERFTWHSVLTGYERLFLQ